VDFGPKNLTTYRITNSTYNLDAELENTRIAASDNNSESLDMLMNSNMNVIYSRQQDDENPIDEFSFLSEIPDEFFTFED
jgi:hypothetical protein